MSGTSNQENYWMNDSENPYNFEKAGFNQPNQQYDFANFPEQQLDFGNYGDQQSGDFGSYTQQEYLTPHNTYSGNLYSPTENFAQGFSF